MASQRLTALQSFVNGLKNSFHTTHLHASNWLAQKNIELTDLRRQGPHLLATASLAGTMALGSVTTAAAPRLDETPKEVSQPLANVSDQEFQVLLEKLQSYANMPAGHLAAQEEAYLEQQLTDVLGFDVTAELEGNRLNHSIGIMGGEQHLHRFPGDSLQQHDAFLEAGIAPNRGAFGWFTQQGELTTTSIEREKYYFAVQTLYLPNWNTDHPTLKPWYAFRKMIAINPHDQVAVVGVVGDAGPAQWVQKQFGGSPEVIREGKIWSKANRGKVILLFVNDPQDKVPLGVIDLQALAPQLQ